MLEMSVVILFLCLEAEIEWLENLSHKKHSVFDGSLSTKHLCFGGNYWVHIVTNTVNILALMTIDNDNCEKTSDMWWLLDLQFTGLSPDLEMVAQPVYMVTTALQSHPKSPWLGTWKYLNLGLELDIRLDLLYSDVNWHLAVHSKSIQQNWMMLIYNHIRSAISSPLPPLYWKHLKFTSVNTL